MFTKILIPTDGSVLGTIAAQEGIKTAAKLGAEVIGINVAREGAGTGVGEVALQPLAEAAAEAGVKFTKDQRISNHAALTIVGVARELGCDLIFIGSNGCAGWDHILLGSVSNKVLATAEIPVLVYRVKKEEVPEDTPSYFEYVFPPA